MGAATGAFRLKYTTEEATQHLSTGIFLNKEMNYKQHGYLISAFNATVKEEATNRLVANADAANLKVDIAIVKPYSGPNEGKLKSADGDDLTWNMVDSEDSPGFELETADSITWWKALYVYTDAGDLLCSLETQDGNHGPVGCKLADENKHDFLFGYRIELWKAKFLGKHEHVDTLVGSMLGPLLKKKLHFTWTNDGGDVLKEVVV